MGDLLSTLVLFLLRLACGISLGMLVPSPREVPGAFFRVHLWVVMGILTLVALAVASSSAWPAGMLSLTIGAAVLSYVGAVVWLYEKKFVGRLLLVMLSMLTFGLSYYGEFAVVAASRSCPCPVSLTGLILGLDVLSSALLLGTTMDAMLLGHWYLNSPGMKLAPLRRLLVAMGGSTVLRMIVCGGGLIAVMSYSGSEVARENESIRAGATGFASAGWISTPPHRTIRNETIFTCSFGSRERSIDRRQEPLPMEPLQQQSTGKEITVASHLVSNGQAFAIAGTGKASGTLRIPFLASATLAEIGVPFLALRWLSGLLAMLPLIAMTWKTLDIPNTQSATGILYVAVICVLLGELVSLRLSILAGFPV